MAKPSVLSIFDSNGKPSRDILGLLTEASLNLYPTIQGYLHKNEMTVDVRALSQFRKQIETSIEDQCRRHTFLMYRLFEVSGDWNGGSDYQVKLSLGKNALKIPASEPFSYEHMIAFEDTVKAAYSEYHLLSKSKSALETEFNNFNITILGKRYLFHKRHLINKILHFIGSKYSLYIKSHNKGLSFIWGHAKIKKIGIYTTLRFTDEIIRSPSFSIANAANVTENEIMTRRDSMHTVFYQKWAPIIQNANQDWRVKSNPYWNISYGIRQHALSLYDWNSPDDLNRIETELVQEMEESIIYHEIGHTIIREIFLDIENVGIGIGAIQYGVYFYDGIYELLADFAPKHQLGYGAMVHLIKLSKTDRKRAERMFYTYLSDVWFFDTDDEFMFDYATMVVLCMLRYINPDKSVDFEGMSKDVVYQEDRTKKTQLTMIERVQELFIWDTDEIGNICKKATFKLGEVEWNFQQVLNDRLQNAKKLYPEIDPQGESFLRPFWTNMYCFIRDFTTEEQKIRTFLDQSVRKNLMKFLVLSCGRKKAEDYKFNHMQYIVDRCFELGLAAYPDQSKTMVS